MIHSRNDVFWYSRRCACLDLPQGTYCQTIGKTVRVIQQSKAADDAAIGKVESPRRIIIVSYCGSRWGTNSDYNYFVKGMIHHLGGFFFPAAEVYELTQEWDWRCPPSILGHTFASVDQRDTQTVYFQCTAKQLLFKTDAFLKWPKRTVQTDLPELSSRVYHHVWCALLHNSRFYVLLSKYVIQCIIVSHK